MPPSNRSRRGHAALTLVETPEYAVHMPPEDAPGQVLDPVAQFVAHHGQDTLNVTLARMDEFLAHHRLAALEDTLAIWPLFGDLLGRSRKQFKNALDGIRDNEPVWMIFIFDPTGKRRRESFEVRTAVGPCGPIKISFEDTLGEA